MMQFLEQVRSGTVSPCMMIHASSPIQRVTPPLFDISFTHKLLLQPTQANLIIFRIQTRHNPAADMAAPRIIIRQPTTKVPAVIVKPTNTLSRRFLGSVITTWTTLLKDLTSPSISSFVSLRSALFDRGSLSALRCILLAVLTNHARRRLFTPILGGTFFFPHCIADLQLARSSPYDLITASLEFNWLPLFAWAAVTSVRGMIGELLREAAAAASEGKVWMVLWMAEGFVRAEYVFVQSCWTVAMIYAFGELLLRGSAEEYEFLVSLKSPKAVAQLALIIDGVHHCLIPMAVNLLCGRWAAVFVVLGLGLGTEYLVEHSKDYGFVLEMSDALVTFAWIVFGMTIVGMEILRKRLSVGETSPGRTAP